ncbi:MAG: arginine--tRNA ligase [Vicinamibacterales bacterium]|nr:arginine--tRNA ligase [Vicinamibacterales bacterium]
MILTIQDTIRTHVIEAVCAQYGLAPEALPPINIGYAPSRSMGDLAVTVAFELARTLRKAPRQIGQELAARLATVPGVLRVECAANGYLNLHLDRTVFLLDRLADRAPLPALGAGAGKTIVEHTAINPNKAAHIGHLRNAALGDTLVRCLRFLGHAVEIQNYIDDTGVQVADVAVGFRELEQRAPADVAALAAQPRFDYLCWDLYARVTEWYDGDKARLAVRAAALHDIEGGQGDIADIGRLVADAIVRCHLRTMARLNVFYDLLTWEGDILRLHFWNRAFATLKAQGSVYFQPAGRLAGCWVMRIDDAAAPPEDAGDVTEAGDDQAEKVIVRSNGTVTYVGKDMAYQFWKFGLLGRDFHYRPFGADGKSGPLWATCSAPEAAAESHPPFGGATEVFNVIDVRQSYLQRLLKQALAAAGHPGEADRSTHFSYEMVALSHQTARYLGYDVDPDDADRPFVEVSGRRGTGVKADDLIDTLIAKAEGEVSKRHPELSPDECRRTASMIAVAAVRYFLVKFSRGKVIAFDIDDALSFEGESGPYLQYAVVRATNILHKIRERVGLDEATVVSRLGGIDATELTASVDDHGLWAVVFEASRLDEVSQQAVRTLEFAVLAKWAFGLAQLFNAFYHRYSVLQEDRGDVQLWRAAGVVYVRKQLTTALDLMGIQVPARM